MKIILSSAVMIIGVAFSDWKGYSQPAQRAPQETTSQVTKEQFERWMTELSNWGRWGKDDQLGAANLITPAKRKQALALATEGLPVSLAHDVVQDMAAEA